MSNELKLEVRNQTLDVRSKKSEKMGILWRMV